MKNGKLLQWMMGLSAVIDGGLALGVFFAQDKMMEVFKVESNVSTPYLASTLGWMVLFAAIVCAYTFDRIRKQRAEGWALSYIYGFWCMGIGLALTLQHGRIDHLFLDTVRGALIVAAARASIKKAGS